MNRDPLALLAYEAKRRPEIKDLVDRIADLSEEEIRAAKVPLPWYRDALLALRKKAQQPKLDPSDIEGVVINPPNRGTILRYTGDDRHVPIASRVGGKGMTYPLKNGDLLFFDGALLWQGTVELGRIKLAFDVVEKDALRSRYSEMILTTGSAVVNDSSNSLAGLRVRFE